MRAISRQCPECGKIYLVRMGHLRQRRHLACSLPCSYAMRAKAKSQKIAFTCAHCGKTGERSPSHFRSKHGSEFCSRACHYAGRSLGLSKRVVTKPYTYTPEGKAAMIASSSKPKGQRAFHPTTCTNCGKIFDDPNDGRKRKSEMSFCSLDCCNSYRKGDKNPAWRGGHPEYYGPDWRSARRAARKRDGCCRRCGIIPNKALDVHHIKPVGTFANPNDAHYPENLVSLCHPCHMWVEWHGIDFVL